MKNLNDETIINTLISTIESLKEYDYSSDFLDLGFVDEVVESIYDEYAFETSDEAVEAMQNTTITLLPNKNAMWHIIGSVNSSIIRHLNDDEDNIMDSEPNDVMNRIRMSHPNEVATYYLIMRAVHFIDDAIHATFKTTDKGNIIEKATEENIKQLLETLKERKF